MRGEFPTEGRPGSSFDQHLTQRREVGSEVEKFLPPFDVTCRVDYGAEMSTKGLIRLGIGCESPPDFGCRCGILLKSRLGGLCVRDCRGIKRAKRSGKVSDVSRGQAMAASERRHQFEALAHLADIG
jgi:hypothetical protein